MRKSVTLKEVGQRALTDKKFFNALVTNVERTLDDEQLELTASDLATLKAALSGPTPGGFDLREFIQKVHTGGLGEVFGQWGAEWMRGWIPPGWPPHQP